MNCLWNLHMDDHTIDSKKSSIYTNSSGHQNFLQVIILCFTILNSLSTLNNSELMLFLLCKFQSCSSSKLASKGCISILFSVIFLVNFRQAVIYFFQKAKNKFFFFFFPGHQIQKFLIKISLNPTIGSSRSPTTQKDASILFLSYLFLKPDLSKILLWMIANHAPLQNRK